MTLSALTAKSALRHAVAQALVSVFFSCLLACCRVFALVAQGTVGLALAVG